MRKSRILTFLFSFVPGAGQMYLGFMEKGVCIMLLFFGVAFLGINFNISAVMVIIPVIWFYSFFDAINSNTSKTSKNDCNIIKTKVDDDENMLYEQDYPRNN